MTRAELQRLADEDLMPLIAQQDPVAFEVFYDQPGPGRTEPSSPPLLSARVG